MLLSEQQTALGVEVRRLLGRHADTAALRRSVDSGVGHDAALWRQLTDGMGLTGVGIAEADGGVGGGWLDLVVIFEALGHSLAHVPFLSTVGLVAPLVDATPPGAGRRDLLKAIAAGETAALVGPGHSEIAATRVGSDWRLDGTAHHVVDGAGAQHLLVVTHRAVAEQVGLRSAAPGDDVDDATDGLLVLWAPGLGRGAGVSAGTVDTFDITRPQATVTFDGALARPLASGPAAALAVAGGRDLAALALAAEQLGVARRCLELACAHARTREQFGRPIGAFQSIKHRLANLFVEVESADAAVYNAAWAVRDGGDVPVAVSVAAAYASDTALQAAKDCLQIHGGMGFTWEHVAHLYLRRAKASQYLLDTPAQHREELARRACFAGEGLVGGAEPPNPDGGSALDAVRTRVREFLAGYLPAGWKGIGSLDDTERREFLRDWRRALQDNRLLAYSWPVQYGGGGGTALEEAVVHEECNRAGLAVWNDNDHLSIQMLGNTLLSSGTEEQCRTFLPRVLAGTDQWCQGYSEPEAGSDLASLRCEAHLDGDEWVITGQKIWTSDAPTSNWIFVLARTDPEAIKHKGISFLMVPLKQPGVQVRPIRNAAGSAHFAEVFFDGARTPASNIVGPVNGGWRTAMKLVEFERGAEVGTLHLMFHNEFVRLLELARSRGRVDDPLIRQRLAWAYSKIAILRFMGARTMAALEADRPPGAQAAITKLFWSEYHAEVTDLALDVLGAEATTPTGRPSRNVVRADEAGAPPSSASWTDVYLKARAGTIYAGTSEIQRNTIAERVLGLPK